MIESLRKVLEVLLTVHDCEYTSQITVGCIFFGDIMLKNCIGLMTG